MRGIALLMIGATLASCAAAPPAGRSADAERHFQKLIAGKVAGQPVSCLPTYRSNDMVVIDDQTVAFRDGSRRVWVTDLGQGCANLGSGFYALVTRRHGGTGLCRGDIAHVADLTSGFTVGSCVMGDFTPYVRPRG
ncbi:MAG TPA: DUF6491 family protein [Sphingomicrobium sp.]|nr:DUF6491 family protein [Sphingomicrobium sp.]